MRYLAKMTGHWAAAPLLVSVLLGASMLVATRPAAGDENDHAILARGAGTTIIHGGTGFPGFVPVLTTLAFCAERSGGNVTGTFECLALAPQAATGVSSGQFNVNAMYVTGQITGATVSGDTATLTGTSSITGLGAGTDVPFTFVVRRGGPGATAVLSVNTLPAQPFHEVLVQGSFEVKD
jgi:hypothetical protein